MITILVTIAIVGFLLWLVNSFIPMQPPINTILNVVAVVALVIWVIRALGLA